MIEIWDALQFLVSLYNIKNAKNTHRGVLLLTKSNTPPWLFFTFFNLQMVPNCAKHRILSLLECFKPFWNYFFLAAKIMELLETLLLVPTPRSCLGPSRGVITPFHCFWCPHLSYRIFFQMKAFFHKKISIWVSHYLFCYYFATDWMPHNSISIRYLNAVLNVNHFVLFWFSLQKNRRKWKYLWMCEACHNFS